MNKFKNWVKSLSLSQQVFALILFFITFFASFFFIYLSGNIDAFIKNQMYDTLSRTQQSLIYSLRSGISINNLFASNEGDLEITHLYVVSDKIIANNMKFLEKKKDLLPSIISDIETLNNSSNTNLYRTNSDTYYVVTDLKDGTFLVSLADASYISGFKNNLLGSVVNITVLVVGLFFIILMVWVGWIIHPLNVIKNYIDKIRNGEEAKLLVTRNDEIGQLADAIVSMRSELSKQEKTKEEMIHNISHDLKTPIATIKSYAESIKDGIYPYDTLEKSVDVIYENADRLERKVHSLLYLNRVEYILSQSTDEKQTNISHLIDEIVQATKLINKDIVITCHVKKNVYFDGSEEPWRVAIENIIENALRYAKTKIDISLEDNCLKIANDGNCMSEERIKSLFKPFEKGREGKFGLGLSIVYKVVSANKYKVYGDNTRDGVVFTIEK